MKGLLLAVEKWASENQDRSTLLVLLICLAMVVLVLMVIGLIAMIMLPPGVWSF